MDTELNKALIRRMFAAQVANDIDSYRQVLADDLVWQIMQFGELGRPRGKEEMVELLGLVHKNLGGSRWIKDIAGMTAEADRVAVEATASMGLTNGNRYEQRYHYLFVVRDGRVVAAREYMDTLAATNAFAGLQAVTSPAGKS